MIKKNNSILSITLLILMMLLCAVQAWGADNAYTLRLHGKWFIFVSPSASSMSYMDNATLSGTPIVLRFHVLGSPVYYYAKAYPASDSITGVSTKRELFSTRYDSTISGLPVIGEFNISGSKYYAKLYPTIAVDVINTSAGGDVLLAISANATLSGVPKVIRVKDSNGNYFYFKVYPAKS